MSATARAAAKPIAESEVVLTRVFDAPRALVFKTWIEPRHLAQWWGPRKFTNPVCELDVRVGGKILIHMRAPDGNTHAMDGEFREIIPNERIVFTTSVDANGHRLLEGHNILTFEDVGGKTRLTLKAKVSGFAEIAKMMVGGFEQGWSQSLERLETLVGDVAAAPSHSKA
jgi:uncharacterized protein YndB with AHSA1/START domain